MRAALEVDDSVPRVNARLECKICWYVYDPAAGDEVWQIPAGTAFDALPAHWCCPVCDGGKEQFLLLDN